MTTSSRSASFRTTGPCLEPRQWHPNISRRSALLEPMSKSPELLNPSAFPQLKRVWAKFIRAALEKSGVEISWLFHCGWKVFDLRRWGAFLCWLRMSRISANALGWIHAGWRSHQPATNGAITYPTSDISPLHLLSIHKFLLQAWLEQSLFLLIGSSGILVGGVIKWYGLAIGSCKGMQRASWHMLETWGRAPVGVSVVPGNLIHLSIFLG